MISHEEIAEMPTSSHVVTLLATLSPGVMAQDQNNNIAHLWSYNAASQFTADGGRNNVYSNNFQLDGMQDMKSGGDVAFIPPMDSVQEFRVQTNAYDASIGRQAGATINMQTKSGGKDYHGTLYEFNQNSAMNANLFQTNLIGGAVAPVHFNKCGGTFGGPVWIPKVYNGTAKTFFFVSFDDTRNCQSAGHGTRLGAERGRAHRRLQPVLHHPDDRRRTCSGSPSRFTIRCRTDPTTGNRTLFPEQHDSQEPAEPDRAEHSEVRPAAEYDGRPHRQRRTTITCRRRCAPDKFPPLSIRADQNWNTVAAHLRDAPLAPSDRAYGRRFRPEQHRLRQLHGAHRTRTSASTTSGPSAPPRCSTCTST